MTNPSPTPQDARAALAEATSQASRVRRADSQFRPILLALGAMYLAEAALVSAFPRGGNVLAGDALLFIFVGGVAGTAYLAWRIRAYSRAGILSFAAGAAAFSLWNLAVIGVSIATGWWGPHQPGIHFGGSAVVAVIPLIVAAWWIGRR